MTLIELRDRLNNVIAENEKRGWQDRNNLPVIVSVDRKRRRANVERDYYPIRYVCATKVGIGACITDDARAEGYANVVELTIAPSIALGAR